MLLERYEPLLRPFLLRLLQDGEDTEDVLCDVFLRLWRTAGRFRGECAPATWIHRIAATSATDLLRRRQVAGRLSIPLSDAVAAMAAPTENEPDQILLQNERWARCAALAQLALAALPAEERVAATLHYLEGLSYRQIAELIAAPVTTVRMRLFRARRRMHARLRPMLDDEEWLLLESPDTQSSGSTLYLCVDGNG